MRKLIPTRITEIQAPHLQVELEENSCAIIRTQLHLVRTIRGTRPKREDKQKRRPHILPPTLHRGHLCDRCPCNNFRKSCSHTNNRHPSNGNLNTLRKT